MTWSGQFRIAVGLLLVVGALPAEAQEFSFSAGETGSLSATSLQLIALVTVLSIAPGLAIMITCFPFVVTVLSILRQAVGLQQSPPNMLIVSLALFITYYVMDPVLTEAWRVGIGPLLEEKLGVVDALAKAVVPFKVFMSERVDPDTYASMAGLRQDFLNQNASADSPLSVLVPSFMLSEISRAFQVGFLIFIPLLIIDLVVAAVLMSMGMMMVPPAIVSLPFKLAFFVVADGWTMVAESLVRSYF
jgi:flagellar biosynthetic protein FliP